MVKGFVTLDKGEDGLYHVKIFKDDCPGRCCFCSKCNNGTVIRIVDKGDIKDWQRYVIDHMERVGQLCREMLDDHGLYQAAILHDVGKFGIPARVLFKKGTLDNTEWGFIKRHPAMGHNILKRYGIEDTIAGPVLSHHERWDGSGYPGGLMGEDIPLSGRYIAVADAYDAMTGERPYTQPMSKKDAEMELMKQGGRQFDPKIVGLFFRRLNEEELENV